MTESSSSAKKQPQKPRPHGRTSAQLRPLTLTLGAQKFAEGSTLIEVGDTRVLTAASIDKRVPPWLADSGRGWVTAEYSMLPRATHTRNRREVSRGKQGGRTLEIQRMIARSLRAAVDLEAMPDVMVTLDCDVLQADGGTRTASVTGAYVALVEALAKSFLAGDLATWPVTSEIAAVSVGLVDGYPLLDLEYVEDSVADVDLNVVATADGELIEVQGTGEGRTFSRQEFDTLLDLAQDGISQLVEEQRRILAPILEDVESLRQHGRRRAAPKDEGELWGAPS